MSVATLAQTNAATASKKYSTVTATRNVVKLLCVVMTASTIALPAALLAIRNAQYSVLTLSVHVNAESLAKIVKKTASMAVSTPNAQNYAISYVIENLVKSLARRILNVDISALDFVEKNVHQHAGSRDAKITISKLLISTLELKMTQKLNLFSLKIVVILSKKRLSSNG